MVVHIFHPYPPHFLSLPQVHSSVLKHWLICFLLLKRQVNMSFFDLSSLPPGVNGDPQLTPQVVNQCTSIRCKSYLYIINLFDCNTAWVVTFLQCCLIIRHEWNSLDLHVSLTLILASLLFISSNIKRILNSIFCLFEKIYLDSRLSLIFEYILILGHIIKWYH